MNGVSRNNPGNLRYNAADKWQGLADDPSDGTFFVFKDPIYGIRAMACTLIAYQDKHNCETVPDFISRWAPPSENATQAYSNFVAAYMEVTSNTQIDVHVYGNLRPMIEAIIQQENGKIWSTYYASAQLDKALVLAGIEAPKKSLVASRQMIGSAIAGTATVAGPIVQQVHDSLQPLTDYSDWIKHIFVGVAVLGIALAAWAKYQERQKGIS